MSGEALKLKLIHKILSYNDVNQLKVLDYVISKIEAYSQDKLETKPLNLSARNMGKIDLWIAATVSVFNGNLITSDQDFNHLDQQYLELIKIVV